MMAASRIFPAAMLALPNVLLLLGTTAAGAQPFAGNDLRDIRVGMAVADLPVAGYAGFACAGDPSRSITAWGDFAACPRDKEGLYAIRFDYDPSTSLEGTLVAGHPAVLTLLVDDKGLTAGLAIETDPKARLYVRKKAFLLGLQVKSRYGAEGWTCRQAPPGNGEQPVGGVYLNEVCFKTIEGRSIGVERRLYREADQDAKSFVDETRILIRRPGG